MIAVHLVGGIIGSVLLGFFADSAVNKLGKDGVFFGGGWSLVGEQILAVVVIMAFSMVVTLIIGLGLKKSLSKGIRVTSEEEEIGLDLTQHSENAYSLERV